MKTLFYTFLLIITCSIISFGQKKYIIKINTLDNHKRKGLLFHVDDKGVYILPKSVRRLSENKVEDIKKAVFIDFRTIKEVKVRRKSSVEKGLIIGGVSGLVLGYVVAKGILETSSPSVNDIIGGYSYAYGRGWSATASFVLISDGGTALGLGLGSIYPHQFKVKSDSTSIQALKIKLQKYEWYHKD